ncbi:glycosyltransferase family 4 protein [Empedobacter falsenii]|uniref:glycosyltransferase family 4 protein n=1 Tax=Empedobacter TaxID=59734 RepID=UPI002576B459|nr:MULTISPECIES: glycosyltransferase family 4 protein [Empedobacter]MDM1042752.1 glycosyltransferase family 4 protein [Empedobacter brevis]MDM1136682.1 glycosyltransferase family 4 protein [Empedobacter sp. R750]
MQKRHKIIFINQSSELYGSDKTLLDLVVGLKTNYNIDPIVIMQQPGLLNLELDKYNIEYHYIPVLKLHKKMFSLKYLLGLAKDSILSVIKLRKIVKKNNVKLIYTNAFSVMLGNVYAYWFKTKHIWHCHEIIHSPKLFVKIYYKLIKSRLVDTVIYNSKSTMKCWVNEDSKILKKANLVYNGIDINPIIETNENVNKLRLSLFPNSTHDSLIYGNIGRISDRKGIEILIDAFQVIHQEYPNSYLLLVGSPAPGKEDFLDQMEVKIKEYQLTNHVKFVPFVNNVYPYWQAMDIVIIPSKEPESFGLVAIEAMLVKKPVIVANHGGLTEIVDNNITGIKFEPNNLIELVSAMKELTEDKEKRILYGENGQKIVLEKFNVDRYVDNIAIICKKLI